jgi:hypothetical protein
MRYDEWKATDDRLKKEKRAAEEVSSKCWQAQQDHHKRMTLQYTLPSGTRTTISDLDGERLVITAANEHGFLTIGLMPIADLEVFLEIRRAIDAWKRGELDDLPWPEYEFAPWRGIKK